MQHLLACPATTSTTTTTTSAAAVTTTQMTVLIRLEKQALNVPHTALRQAGLNQCEQVPNHLSSVPSVGFLDRGHDAPQRGGGDTE